MMSQDGYIPAPGRIRGEWSQHGVLYLAGDAVCTIDESVSDTKKYAWFVAKETHTSSLTSKPQIDSSSVYWETSPWSDATSEVSQPDYRFQRVHSVSPDTIDSYLSGKGVPSWYYYDLLGYFNSRTNLRHPIELLTSIRGTIAGLKAWLNLINLDVAEVTRLTPEEHYVYCENPDSPDKELTVCSYEKWREFIAEDTDLNNNIHMARYWCDDIDIKSGDYIFYNKYDEANAHKYHTDEQGYCGCEVYRAKRDIRSDEFAASEPKGAEAVDENWTYITGYYVNPIEGEWEGGVTPDNSYYLISVSQLAGNSTVDIDGKNGIADEKNQQIYSCYIRRLMEFLVPAWIRFESGLLLADSRVVKTCSAAYSVSEMHSDEQGLEPYTLTIYPFVGFDPSDVAYVDHGEFSHTEAWKTSVQVLSAPPTPVPEYDIWSVESGIDWKKVQHYDSLLFNGTLSAYMWREGYIRPHEENPNRAVGNPNFVNRSYGELRTARCENDEALIKVRMLARQKIRLRAYSIYDDSYTREWQEGVRFEKGEVIKHTDGRYYKARRTVQNSIPPDHPDNGGQFWKLISYGNSPRRYFWRWQLLNNYHNVPRFSLGSYHAGPNTHRDLKERPFRHKQLVSYSHYNTRETA